MDSHHPKETHKLHSFKKEANMFLSVKKATQELTMKDSLLKQLKDRRLDLGLRQSDMMMRVGVSRQQYQRLESKGNPRLDTLELIAEGLNSELILIPKEKMNTVIDVLRNVETSLKPAKEPVSQKSSNKEKSLSDNPWQDLLGEDQ
jgi:transcriptional regulator with XRE-family HTH domain